jgi:hypothetical protein
MSSNDRSNLKAIEVLVLHLDQNPLQRAVRLWRPQRPEEHRLDFRSHEKEIPSGSMILRSGVNAFGTLTMLHSPKRGSVSNPISCGIPGHSFIRIVPT